MLSGFLAGHIQGMFFYLTFLGQLLVFLSDLAVLLFWNRIRENVHTVVLLGK